MYSRRSCLGAEKNESESRIQTMLNQVKTKEAEMALIDQQVKEKRALLSTLVEYRDIKALNTEIDTLGRLQINNEQGLIQLWNKLEQVQKEAVRLNGHYEQQGTLLEAEYVQLEQRLAEKTRQIEVMREERIEKETIVPREWLENYTTMATRVADPVVKVEYDACSACSTSIAKQDLLRLERRAVLPCRLCFRLLYLPRVMGVDVVL
jgi:predicted  nucleic acid-binding Zn-ribbon protein